MKKGWIFTAAGLLLLAIALGMLCSNLVQDRRAGEEAETALEELKSVIPSALPVVVPAPSAAAQEELPEATTEPAVVLPLPEKPGSAETDSESAAPADLPGPDAKMPLWTMNDQRYVGVLKIPALNKELPIINDWSYDALKLSPCRYYGSAYRDNLIICAHNYEHHFGAIKKLRRGDAVSFTDLAGNEFLYEVTSVRTLRPDAVEEIRSGDDWDLTLFTCTKGGATRVTVRCVRTDGAKSPDVGEASS